MYVLYIMDLYRHRRKLLVELINADDLKLEREIRDLDTELHLNALSFTPPEEKEAALFREIVKDFNKTLVGAVRANRF